jgi:hypothetical protein
MRLIDGLKLSELSAELANSRIAAANRNQLNNARKSLTGA